MRLTSVAFREHQPYQVISVPMPHTSSEPMSVQELMNTTALHQLTLFATMPTVKPWDVINIVTPLINKAFPSPVIYTSLPNQEYTMEDLLAHHHDPIVNGIREYLEKINFPITSLLMIFIEPRDLSQFFFQPSP